MHSRQITWNPQTGWTPVESEPEKASLVFYFGPREMLACGERYGELRRMFQAAHIGRRLLMGQRTCDETEAAGAELGSDTPRVGFYSYGEISPHAKSGICELHNQTMTVTTFAEVEA
jgi:FIST-like protein